jgi:hypothetical protein
MLLCTTTDDKFLHAFGILQQNYNKQKTKKDFSKFSNEMCFLFLHYTSKNEKKGHECCQKQTIIRYQFFLKKFKRCMQQKY